MRRLLISVTAIFMLGIFGTMPTSAASSFADPAFQRTWQAGEAATPNFWGPLTTAKDGRQEPYKEAPGGSRLVQYFDKGRMELSNPTSGIVTNGLLATDLIKGQVQVGDATFQPKQSPTVSIAGDLDNPGPTYAGLADKGASLFAAATAKPGTFVTLIAAADGSVTDGGGYAGISMSPALAGFDATTQHNVLGVFSDYRNRVGLLSIGLAISEPVRANVKVAGTSVTVLAQVFERRVLTYTATNPDPFKVEMGNIGLAYYLWLYSPSAAPVAAPPAAPTHAGPADLYPDPSLTPGDVFPNVTAKEVCVSGYSASVRSVSSDEKRQVAARYGYTGPSSDVEYDHFISLELGGSNAVTNLWPERYVTVDAPGQVGARAKDRVENALHAAVCRGDMTLQQAQDQIRTDWYAYFLTIPQ